MAWRTKAVFAFSHHLLGIILYAQSCIQAPSHCTRAVTPARDCSHPLLPVLSTTMIVHRRCQGGAETTPDASASHARNSVHPSFRHTRRSCPVPEHIPSRCTARSQSILLLAAGQQVTLAPFTTSCLADEPDEARMCDIPALSRFGTGRVLVSAARARIGCVWEMGLLLRGDRYLDGLGFRQTRLPARNSGRSRCGSAFPCLL